MADVQPEHGFTKIADELLEMIPRFKFNGTQLRIILIVLRYTYGFSRKDHEMSLSFMVKATGLGKTQIDREITQLIAKKVILVTSESTFTKSRRIGLNKNYDTWEIERSDRQQIKELSANLLTVSKNAEEQSANLRTPTVSEFADQDIHSSLQTTLKIEEEVISESEIMSRSVEVEKHYCKKRNTFQASMNDFAEIKRLVASRIPVSFIKASIDRSFAEYAPKYVKDEIRTFSYCALACYDRWAKEQARLKPVGSEQHAKGRLGGSSPNYRGNEKARENLSISDDELDEIQRCQAAGMQPVQ